MTVEIQKAHIETQIRKAGQMRQAAEQRFEKRVDAIQSERGVTRQTAYALATEDAEAQQAYNAVSEIQELEREQVAALHKLYGLLPLEARLLVRVVYAKWALQT